MHYFKLGVQNSTERKKNYVGRENSPYINSGKGDTLAPKSRESPPPQSYKTYVLMGVWRVIGSTQLQNLVVTGAGIECAMCQPHLLQILSLYGPISMTPLGLHSNVAIVKA
eukprot:1152439-Pelagomonas_calceolata.AAC.4